MKKILIMLILIISANIFAASITVPWFIISSGITKIFPIEKEKFSSSIKLYDPIVDAKDDKIIVTVSYNSKILKKELNGIMNFSSSLYFDNDLKYLYLKNPKLVSLKIGDTEYNPDNNFITRNLLNLVYSSIEKKPIMDTTKNSVTNFLDVKDIFIENSNVKVSF